MDEFTRLYGYRWGPESPWFLVSVLAIGLIAGTLFYLKRMMSYARLAQEQGRNLELTNAELCQRTCQQYHELIAESLPHLVWVADRLGLVEYVNHTWTEYTGLGNQRSQGQGWIDIVHPDQRSDVLQAWDQACVTGDTYKNELQLRDEKGLYRWFKIRAVPLKDSQGNIQKWLGTSSDIHDSKCAAEGREHLVFELQQAVRVRDEFLSIASHELRTPLTTLMLQLSGICVGNHDPKVADRCLKVKRQAERLEALVEKLLDVSCIQANGSLKLDLEPVDLGLLTARVVGELTRQRPGSSAVELLIDKNIVGRWDRVRLVQVVTNLLTNALKYGLNRPIEVSVRGSDELAVLAIHDDGMGIDPCHQGRIFGRFERAVSERNYGGLGLGLWISREIVQALNGRIYVASVLGKGSTFTVELPLCAAHGNQGDHGNKGVVTYCG